MQVAHESFTDNAMIDLLEILYWRVVGMGRFEVCGEEGHIQRNEILALIEDVREALRDTWAH